MGKFVLGEKIDEIFDKHNVSTAFFMWEREYAVGREDTAAIDADKAAAKTALISLINEAVIKELENLPSGNWGILEKQDVADRIAELQSRGKV